MLLAETAYNIFLALPDGEKERLHAMMEKQKTQLAKHLKPTKKSKIWTVEECTEVVLPLMIQRRDKKLRGNLKIV